MIVPTANSLDLDVVAAAASAQVGKEPDYEVWGPSETVASGSRYVTHMPRDFQIVEGIRFSTFFRGTGTVLLNVTVDGTNLFMANQAIGADTQVIPLAAVIPAYQASVIPAGAKIMLLVISAPVTSSGTFSWLGLRMAPLGKTP